MAAVLASVLFLSTTGIIIRHLTEGYQLSPLILAFWRNLFLVLLLGLILEIFYPRLIELKRKYLFVFALYGLILFLFNLLWTYSVKLNGAGVATVLVCLSGIFTVILGRLFLQEELSFIKVIVCLISFVGTVCIADVTDSADWTGHLMAILCGVGAGLCYALYSLAGRSIFSNRISPWTAMFYGFLYSTFYFFCIILLGNMFIFTSGEFCFFQLGMQFSGWGYLMLLAVGPTLLGFGLMNVSLASLHASTVNIILTAEPVLTIIWASLLLNESLGTNQIAGSILIIGAILCLALSELLDCSRVSIYVSRLFAHVPFTYFYLTKK